MRCSSAVVASTRLRCSAARAAWRSGLQVRAGHSGLPHGWGVDFLSTVPRGQWSAAASRNVRAAGSVGME